MMDEKNIRKYAKLMQELGLSGIEISENGSTVRLERSVAAPQQAPAPADAAAPVEAKPAVVKDLEICSPMVGVFYSSSAENADTFVHVGDTIRKGDVLCIIEAMKLMNEIVAEQDGVITEVCVANNEVVDFGRVLFRYRKDA